MRIQRGHATGDGEGLLVLFALDQLHLVVRRRQTAALQEFLQTSLGVLQLFRRRQVLETSLIEPLDEGARRRQVAVEIDGADQCLQRIGQNRLPPEAAALQLTRAELDLLTQGQIVGEFRQRLSAYQRGSQPAQMALVGLGQGLVQSLGNGEAEDGVAEEFKALVVLAAGAPVRQRAREEIRVLARTRDRLRSTHDLYRRIELGHEPQVPDVASAPGIGCTQFEPAFDPGDLYFLRGDHAHVLDIETTLDRAANLLY